MWEIAVRMAVAGGVYDGVFLCCPFSHEMSWMRSWTYLSQFLRVSLHRGLTGGFLLLRIFSFAISVSPHVYFILDIILISMFLS